ncbi:tellurite resistance TerB family protein [Rhizobium sp. CFBP 8762]|uniref:tellurite resistance TerB family protein n=1 Tax=Rhizobium sp. CFBP 8762 TaxID=2775279 RepID=UPI001FD40E0B|nr:tellurite resistance TerB family protein [Rhizobium sp. CFBP 8762]
MLDPKKLLEQFLGGQSGDRSRSGQSAGGQSMGGLFGGGSSDRQDQNTQSGQSSGGGLGGLGGLGSALGGGNLRDTANQAIDMIRNNPGKAAGLAAVLFGTGAGRKMAGPAIQMGGLAAIAGLAYKAYQSYQAGQAPADPATAQPIQHLPAPPADSGFHPDLNSMDDDFALVLVRAMIAASKADGHVDAEERTRIMEKLSVSGLGSEAEAFLEKELANPIDIDAIVAACKSEEQRVELYTASRLTVNADNRAERGYLDLLAGRLGMADALVDHVEATVSAAHV